MLAERGDVQLAFCWSYVRGRFYELAAAGSAPIASEALERNADLYAVEKDIRGRSADERRAMRQDRSRPIIDELKSWLRAKLAPGPVKQRPPNVRRRRRSRRTAHSFGSTRCAECCAPLRWNRSRRGRRRGIE
jgi:hypothetical protein